MNISSHFTDIEFQDDHTGEVLLADGFIENLEYLRVQYDSPIIVTDGCRSREYNQWLRDRGYKASENSFHLMDNKKYKIKGTCALDIARPRGLYLHRLLGIAIPLQWAIGLGSTFIHLDRRVDYTELSPTVYTYK